MRYWLYPQYYGGGKGPTLRGAIWKWIKRVASLPVLKEAFAKIILRTR